MTEKLLIVDDEDSILQAIERLFQDHPLEILKASSGQQALEIIRANSISVVLTDNHMPKMHGLDFLKEARRISPDTSRIMMTAFADLKTALSAINNCDIYRFVTKPWEEGEIESVVEEGVSRYQLLKAMRHGDESILLSLVRAIELKDPYTRGHCMRVGTLSTNLAEKLGYENKRIDEIKFGAWLHDCGKIGVPEQLLNSRKALSSEDYDIVKQHPEWGADVAQLANLSPVVVNIILHHHEKFDGSGYPYGLEADNIPVEAAIVGLADTYDALTTDRPYHPAISHENAMETIESLSGIHFPSELCTAFLVINARKQIA